MGRALLQPRRLADGSTHSLHPHALRQVDQSYEAIPEGGVIVLSEPLDDLAEHWQAVPESSLVLVDGGSATISAFEPI